MLVFMRAWISDYITLTLCPVFVYITLRLPNFVAETTCSSSCGSGLSSTSCSCCSGSSSTPRPCRCSSSWGRRAHLRAGRDYHLRHAHVVLGHRLLHVYAAHHHGGDDVFDFSWVLITNYITLITFMMLFWVIVYVTLRMLAIIVATTCPGTCGPGLSSTSRSCCSGSSSTSRSC